MRKTIIKLLNQLNLDFYRQISVDFSQSRNFSWQGWSKFLQFLPKKQNLQILDIACGNGRFVDFLQQNFNLNFSYLGLDSSGELLEIARKKYPKVKFELVDLVEKLLKNEKQIIDIQKKFDLIVVFGLTHHLASTKLKELLFKNLKMSLSDGGLIIVSNWQFAREKDRFAKNILTWSKIIGNWQIDFGQKIKLIYLWLHLTKNDYLLDWRKGLQAHQAFRYCHQIDEEEMFQLVSASGLRIVDSFFADGKSGKLNQYFLLTAL